MTLPSGLNSEKNSELPIDECIELIEKLISEDTAAEEKASDSISEIEKQIKENQNFE